MKILIPGLVNNIQLKRLASEGKTRGHSVEGCYASDLVVYVDGRNFTPIVPGKDLKSFDLVYLMVSKRRWEWYCAVSYLHEKYKTVVINQKIVDPKYQFFLTPLSDYFRQYEEKVAFPKSAVIYSSKMFDLVENMFEYPLVLKPVLGRKGKSVYKVENKEELVVRTNEILEDSLAVVVREFIPNDGDIRVFTVGYRAIGAMKRIPPEEDFRSNISVGGRGEKFDLEKNSEVRKLAEKASFITRTEVAGVDIIIDKLSGKCYVLEVNPSPQFEGLEKYTGVNAAMEIIKYFEKIYLDSGGNKIK
jgi:ribosomal protein S6--L-glutamate ligase